MTHMQSLVLVVTLGPDIMTHMQSLVLVVTLGPDIMTHMQSLVLVVTLGPDIMTHTQNIILASISGFLHQNTIISRNDNAKDWTSQSSCFVYEFYKDCWGYEGK